MNRKSGVILGIALIIFLVISIIGAALMTVVMSRARQTNDLEKRTQAYFFARSGVEIAREYVNEISKSDERFFDEKVIVLHGDLSSEDNGELSFHFQDVTNVWSKDNVRASFEASASSFRNHEVVTAIWRNSESTNFLSSGNAGDMTRTLAFMCSEGSAGIPVFDMAIFADGKIETGASANSKVIGDIGTNSTDTSAISRQGNNGNGQGNGGKKTVIDGDVFFGPGTDVDELDPNDYFLEEGHLVRTLENTRDYKSILPEFPDFPVLTERDSLSVNSNESIINDDGYYSSISMEGKNKNNEARLTIETGSSSDVRKIVIGQLEMKSYASIELSGNGKLNLYVGNISGGGSINIEGDQSEIDRVVVYYKGTSLGDLDLRGTIHIKNEIDDEFRLGGNSNLRVSGLLIYEGSKIKLYGTPSAKAIALFAPYAEITTHGNPDFYGAIVCERFLANGEGTVNYKKVEDEFSDTSLEIIDGDGEEAFEQWGE
ncbi:hypothetical protein [Mesotoga sp. UBA6090]|uniref:hypothetical protein n=1 Tax=Mesotoga sp. UBA6090 TaxID=1946860 RepID=UPI0025CF47BC|nr:hypothetical protein [Mesotoga sp. UBA6090]